MIFYLFVIGLIAIPLIGWWLYRLKVASWVYFAISIAKMLRILSKSKGENRATRLRGNLLAVNFSYNSHECLILLPIGIPKRWHRVTILRGTEQEDVTREVMKYAGPSKDFFSLQIIPRDIYHDCTHMSFHFSNKLVGFDANELIKF